MKHIKKLFAKYKDVVYYVIFGVATTLVNVVVYWIAAHFLGIETIPSSILAWIAAVSFAYITNRKWVFHSEASTVSAIVREIFYFFLCRLTTGILDWVFMYVSVDVLGFYDVLMKLIANVMVIVLNYIASKLVIFRKDVNK